MSVTSKAEFLSPDFLATLRRFPLAIAFQAIATVTALAFIFGADFMLFGDEVSAIAWPETGAIFALAGALFSESRPAPRPLALFLAYGLPIVAVAAFMVHGTTLLVTYLLPAVGIFWLSISAFTQFGSAADNAEQQDRFWWLNYHALTNGLLALAGAGVVYVGAVTINVSLAALFGISIARFPEYVLIVAVGLLAPIYWLSTIPRLSDYQPRSLKYPDFVLNAAGFVGRYVMVPILFAYAVMLLAYTAQILVQGHLPEGMLGWMVLAFVTAGAGTWLLVYPPFMRDHMLVRWFRRWWFWLTLIPLALLAGAVWTRIGVYGWTNLRMLVLAGGVWAGLLALIFLPGRGDIRLIPALGGIILLLLAVGPWNIENWPRTAQAQRLEAALDAAGVGTGSTPHWTPQTIGSAKSAIYYLSTSAEGELVRQAVLNRHKITDDGIGNNSNPLIASIGIPPDESVSESDRTLRLNRADGEATDISATPYFLGPLTITTESNVGPMHFALAGGNLVITDAAGSRTVADLGLWAKAQAGALQSPVVDFKTGDASYRIGIETVELLSPLPGATEGPKVTGIYGELFSSAPLKPAAKPTP